MLGIDRTVAPPAGSQEDIAVLLVHGQLDRESPGLLRVVASLRDPARRSQLTSALRPDDGIDLRVDDPPGQGGERELSPIAGLDEPEFIRLKQRDDLIRPLRRRTLPVLTATGRRRTRPQLHIDRVAVGWRIHCRLIEVPLSVGHIGAAAIDRCLGICDLGTCHDNGASSPLTRAEASASPSASLAFAVASCASKFDRVRFGLFKREFVTGAGATSSRSRAPASAQIEPQLHRRDLPTHGLQLRLQFAIAGRCTRQAGNSLREFRFVGRELGFGAPRSFW